MARPDGRLLLAFAALHCALWFVLPGLTQLNPPLDVMISYSWGRELQWGYAKHPPLPTALQEMLFRLTGLPSWSAYLLSQISVAATFLAVWLLGRRVAAPAWAALGAMLLAGITYFQYPTPEFNHNVLQMPFWAWGIYLCHRCWRGGGTASWLALGVVLALGLYTKYSMAVLPLVALVFFLLDPLARRRLADWRPWAAAAVTIALLLPHLQWLVAHDFLPVTYAQGRGGAPQSLFDRTMNPFGFALNELADHIPLLVALALLLFWPWGSKATAQGLERPEVSAADRRFLLVFGLGPLAAVMILSLILGFDPKSAWGAPMFSLSGLLVLMLARPAPRAGRLRAAVVFLFALTILTSLVFGLHHLVGSELRGRATKGVFPGPAIAERLVEVLPEGMAEGVIVSGPEWEASNAAFYMPGRPPVLMNGKPELSNWFEDGAYLERPLLLVWPDGRENHWRPAFLGDRAPLAEGQVSASYRHSPGLAPLVLNYAVYGPQR